MAERASGDVTLLLREIRAGNSRAADQLMPLILEELRSIARLQFRRERANHTLQPTALVNEAYLRLVKSDEREWQNRAHFIGVSVSIMRRILIDHARHKRAMKRDGGVADAAPSEANEWFSNEQADELLALNIALDRLEEMSSRQRQVVELRHFGGLSLEETAEVLNVSLVTVKRDWIAARAWLKAQIRPMLPR